VPRREDDVSGSLLRQMIQDADDKHEEAHQRIRNDHRALQADHEALKAKLANMELSLERMVTKFNEGKDAPINIGKIVFDPRMVLAIAGLVASIVTGNWFTLAPVREGMVILKEQVSNNIQLQDERSKNIDVTMKELKAAIEMRRLEIQQVSNDVQQLRRQQR
jgi:prefoldin subunit 5